MIDPTFDPRLAEQLRRYATTGVDPFDPLEIAEAAVATRAPVVRRRDPRLLLVAALVLFGVLLAAALAAGAFRQPTIPGSLLLGYFDAGAAPASRGAARIELSRGSTSAVVSRKAYVSISPDGRTLVYQSGPDIHLVDAQTSRDVRLAGAAPGTLRSRYDDGPVYPDDGVRAFAWSPGGTWVSWMSCTSDGCLGTIAASDGSRTHPVVGAGPDPVPAIRTSFWWWTDDDHLFIDARRSSDTRLARSWLQADGDGSNAVPCTAVCGSDKPGGWLVGQDALGFATFGVGSTSVADFPNARIDGFASSPDDATAAVVIDQHGPAEPEGEQLRLVERDGTQRRVDPGGDLRPLTDGSFAASFAYSPNGSRLVVIATHGTATNGSDLQDDPGVVVVDPAAATVIAALDDVALARWSPDSRWIALVRAGDRGIIDIVDADGGGRRWVGEPVGGTIDQVEWVR